MRQFLRYIIVAIFSILSITSAWCGQPKKQKLPTRTVLVNLEAQRAGIVSLAKERWRQTPSWAFDEISSAPPNRIRFAGNNSLVADLPTNNSPIDIPPTIRINPYLEGFTPTDPRAVTLLPAIIVRHISSTATLLVDSIAETPGRLIDALPRIKTFHAIGSNRKMVLASVRCPVEVATGNYFAPTNLVREALNGLFATLNESERLSFDIQLACS